MNSRNTLTTPALALGLALGFTALAGNAVAQEQPRERRGGQEQQQQQQMQQCEATLMPSTVEARKGQAQRPGQGQQVTVRARLSKDIGKIEEVEAQKGGLLISLAEERPTGLREERPARPGPEEDPTRQDPTREDPTREDPTRGEPTPEEPRTPETERERETRFERPGGEQRVTLNVDASRAESGEWLVILKSGDQKCIGNLTVRGQEEGQPGHERPPLE